MGDEEKKNEDETVKDDEKVKQQINEGEVEEKNKGAVVNDDQKKQELERLEEEKEKLADIRQKEEERVAQLTLEKENLDKIELEAKLTTEDLLKSYENQDQDQKGIIEERSKRSLETKDVSQKIDTIRETKGKDDPELVELEAKLKKFEEDARAEDDLEKDIIERKEKLEKLLKEHAASLREIDAKKKAIDEEIVKLALQRKARELEEKKILARIAELRGNAAPGEGLHSADHRSDRPRSSMKRDSRKGSFPLIDPSAIAQLREEGARALTAAKAMTTLREEIAKFVQKGHLTEEDMKIMPQKQNELLFRLAELDEITRQVQRLMGMTEIAKSELGPPRRLTFLSDYGVRPSARTLSQLRPEHTLPQVVICGHDIHYPQIIVCDSSKFRNIQEGILQNGRFHSGTIVQHETSPSFPTPEAGRRNNTQWINNSPGARPDMFSPMRQGDGLLMRMGPPYYGSGMMASNQGLMGSFGQGNMGMPIASWMITPGFGYTMQPMQGTMMMPQRMAQAGIVPSSSVVAGIFDLEEKKKKLDEEIEGLDKSLEEGNLTKSQYDLQMEEKTKEREDIAKQLKSQETKDDQSGVPPGPEKEQEPEPVIIQTMAEPEMKETSPKSGSKSPSPKKGSKSPSSKEESKEPSPKTETERKESENSKQSSRKEGSKEPSSKESRRASSKEESKEPSPKQRKRSSSKEARKEPSQRKGSKEEFQREGSETLSLKSSKEPTLKVRKRSSLKEGSKEPSPTTEGVSKESESTKQPSAEEGSEEQSVTKEASKPPSTGQDEEPSVINEPEAEVFPRPPVTSESNDGGQKSGSPNAEPEVMFSPSFSSLKKTDGGAKEDNRKKSSVQEDNRRKSSGQYHKLVRDGPSKETKEERKKDEAKGSELLSVKEELLYGIKKWGDPEKARKTIDEQKEALNNKLKEVQLELRKLESTWKDMGFFGSVVCAAAAIKKKAQATEEGSEAKKKRLHYRAKELEYENKRRERRIERINSQVKEVDYLLKENEIDEAEYNQRKKVLDAEMAAVEEDSKMANEEMRRIPEQLKTIEQSVKLTPKVQDPEAGLMKAKIQLEKQLEQLDNQIEEKTRELRKYDVEDEEHPDEMEEGDTTKEVEGKDHKETQAPAANESGGRTSETQGKMDKATEEVEAMKQMRNALQDELAEINGALMRMQAPRQRAVLWGAVAAIVFIHIIEFSNTFTVVH